MTSIKYNLPVCGLVLAHEATTWWQEGPTVGHVMYFDKYNVRSIELGGIEFFLIPETACLAISTEPLT